MQTTPITTIPNRPAGAPIFDFALDGGRYARVPLTTVSNDGATLVMSAWAYLIDAQGLPVLAEATAAPTATSDSTHSVMLSGVLAGTHTLYDGWVKYIPPAGTAIDAEHLPEGWASGTGAPGEPGAAYGAGYYDTTSDQGYVWSQGELARVAQGCASALAAQIDTAAKLSALGL
jgi:hypothetical protein